LKRLAAPRLVFIFGIEDLLRLWRQVTSTLEALENLEPLVFPPLLSQRREFFTDYFFFGASIITS